MNIAPLTYSQSSLSSNANTLPSQYNGASTVSSPELASVRLAPSVQLNLSSHTNAIAATNATIPPIYSRVSIAATSKEQLSPNRLPVENAGNITTSNSVKASDTVAPGAVSQGNGAQANNSVAGDNAEEGNQTVDETANDERPAKDAQAENSEAQDRAADSSIGSEPVNELTDEQRDLVEALKLRDQEVRAHERAHKSTGGRYTGAVSFSYQEAPDGKRYAVGGEVPIDIAPVAGDLQATIVKMNTVKAAALAPSDPSSQDKNVAATAARIIAEARSDLAIEKQSESKSESLSSSDNNGKKYANAATQFEKIAGFIEVSTSQIDAVV